MGREDEEVAFRDRPNTAARPLTLLEQVENYERGYLANRQLYPNDRVLRLCAKLREVVVALQLIIELKDEAYHSEPISLEAADVVARNAGRIAKNALTPMPEAP